MRHSLLHQLSLLEQRHTPQPQDSAAVHESLLAKLAAAWEGVERVEVSEDEAEQAGAQLRAWARETRAAAGTYLCRRR
jgi:hypothetical protein